MRGLLTCRILGVGLLASTGWGCASSPQDHLVYLGQELVPAQSQTLALAAGDGLGRAVFVNDVLLAARLGVEPGETTVATVPIELGFDR